MRNLTSSLIIGGVSFLVTFVMWLLILSIVHLFASIAWHNIFAYSLMAGFGSGVMNSILTAAGAFYQARK